ISTAHGSWTGYPTNTLGNKASNYTLEMAYENMHRITTKQQEHIRDASNVGENTYDNLFKYEDVNHPNAVTSIENQSNSEVEEFNYDANGNVLLHEFDNGDTKNMLWDEANMLKAIKISNAGSFQHYIYDANGERTLKGIGQYGLMDLNGLSQTVSTIGNYSQYVSGYMVMGPHYMVTNHYYSGTERIACKLVGSVDSSIDNSLELSGSEKAGLPDRQAEDLELVRTEFGFDTLIIEDTDPEEDDCEGNNDCPNVLYFFHPDHIGSSTFLTDEDGNPYQFLLYLPFGESMAEQKAGGYSTKYRFTGKEVDEETGLYYFGARYYDPRISQWFGVDPLAEVYYDYGAYVYTANNPIKYIDPDGRGWYEDECGTPTFNKDLNSKEDFIKSGIKGSFIGNSALSIDDNGNQTSFNKDGTKTTSVQLDEVSVTAEKPQYGYYGGIWGQLNADKSAGAAFSDAGSEVMSEVLSNMATFGVGGLGVKSAESFTILGSKKSSYSLVKGALLKVFAKLGIDGPLPQMKNGKWGSPQRGDQNKGYRLDNRGTPSSNNPNEQGAHINYWDYTKGKRKTGAGIKDAVPLK
ncbi:MAG: RHS repeat-associated core domain-containing protein, partial [Saprospiraceae bacterium]